MAVDMSSEELRAHLFRSLQERGVLDSVKSQLRNKLAIELQRASRPPLLHSPKKACNSMTVQVANGMVAEYLKKAGYSYTLSVFLPEAGVNMDKLFTSDELLQYLKITPSSSLHHTLQPEEEKGFLIKLLEGLATHAALTSKESTSVQTEGEGSERNVKTSVAMKLQALEDSYAQRAEEENRRYQQTLEERMAAFQRESESRYKRQLEVEMAHFREREVAGMRVEERERFQEEVGRMRGELHGVYQQKMEGVRKMELETLERLRRKEQELEAGIFSQRQAVLDELDALRVREAELKRQAELNCRAASLEEEHARSMVEQLATKERALQQAKEQQEEMAEERVRRYKLDCEAAMQSKREELTRWEAGLQSRQQQVSSMESDCQRLRGELGGEREKAERLQGLLHDTTSKLVILQQQKDALQQKVGQLSDCHLLKQQLSDTQKQLMTAERKFSEAKSEHKKRHSEQQQVIRQLQTKLSRPSPEQLTLQSELEQMQKAHHRQMLVVEYENKQLRKQLGVQSEYSLELQKQLDEQTVQLRSAQREVDDLHSQLKHFHVGFLRERKPGTETKRSQPFPRRTTITVPLSTSSKLPPHSFTHKPHSTLLTDDLLMPLDQNLNFSDASGQFLAETRATFSRLEKEAEELEESYQKFQHQIRGGPILEDPNSPPHSPSPVELGGVKLFPLTSSSSAHRCAYTSAGSVPTQVPTNSSHVPLLGTTQYDPLSITSPVANIPTALLAPTSGTFPTQIVSSVHDQPPPSIATPLQHILQIPLDNISPPQASSLQASPPPASPLQTSLPLASPLQTSPLQTSPPPASPLQTSLPQTSPLQTSPPQTSLPQASPQPASPLQASPPPTSPLQTSLPLASPLQTSLPLASPLQTSPLQTSPLQTSPPQTSLPLASPPQASPPQTSPPQASPPPTSPLQTSLPLASPLQTSPLQTSPLQTSPLQTSPPQTSPPQTSLPLASPPQASPPQTSPPQASPLQASPLQASPLQASPPPASPPQASPPQASPQPAANTTHNQETASRPPTTVSTDHFQSADVTAAGSKVVANAPRAPKLSLDDLWKDQQITRNEITTTNTDKTTGMLAQVPKQENQSIRTSGGDDHLGSSWSKGRGERERRRLEEEERVSRELKELERLESEKQVRQQQQMEPAQESEHSPPEVSSPRAELPTQLAGAGDEGEVDTVMRKYMEIVRQKREQQKATATNDSRQKQSQGHEEDYGLPSLSHDPESFGGLSDHDDPFEDW